MSSIIHLHRLTQNEGLALFWRGVYVKNSDVRGVNNAKNLFLDEFEVSVRP